MAEKYYNLSPYAYCANNPVNFVDPDGRSWYYNSDIGDFVAHIEDDDDFIYLITPDQINNANGDDAILSSYRQDTNKFGQLALENLLSESIICTVIGDLYNRTNVNGNGEKFVNKQYSISVNSDMAPIAQVKLKGDMVYLEVKPEYFYFGYDTMVLLSHEIGHMVDKISGTMSNNPMERERYADYFARNHWSFKKSSNMVKQMIYRHETQYH